MNEDIRKRIGEQLKSIRLQRNLSQQALSEMLNIQQATISKIEKGKFAITIDMLQRFADVLNFKIELLYL